MIKFKPAPELKHQPALRLVSTHELSRDDWLAVRKRGIGSSDASAAVGINPYQSQLELWLIKTGRDANLPIPDFEDDNLPTYWGNILEPIVAAHYMRRTDTKVRRINAVLQHPTIPWMLANIDREVLGNPEVAILECKTAGIFGSRLWKYGVPEYIQIQVQHQLAVTGKMAADVAVLLGGQELQIHRINRDDALITQLITLEKRFWSYVESDTPPPADGSESAGVSLRVLFPQDNGMSVDFKGDRNMNGMFSDWLEVRNQLSELEKQELRYRQTLQQGMGEATRAEFEHGIVSWKKTRDSVSLDTAAVLAVHPELLQQFPKPRHGSRRFVLI
ncbi:MAG: YqaJ viral recombinase family nuclease [Burkholderiales bacterium]